MGDVGGEASKRRIALCLLRLHIVHQFGGIGVLDVLEDALPHDLLSNDSLRQLRRLFTQPRNFALVQRALNLLLLHYPCE